MTNIEWTGETLNPTTGCDRISPGCDRCYAMTMAKRLKGMGQAKYQNDGDPKTSGPGFALTMHDDVIYQPLTGNELEDLGLLQTPTWARKDVIGEPATVSIPAPLGPKDRALIERTQPLSLDEIAAGIAARAAADNDTAKEHPQP